MLLDTCDNTTALGFANNILFFSENPVSSVVTPEAGSSSRKCT